MSVLHQKLKDDAVEIACLKLSRVLRMKDRSLLWLILVPEREDIKEIHDPYAIKRSFLIREAFK